MADSLFEIFGDHLTRQSVKNVTRQPLFNIENMGKTVSTGPLKPNETKKAGEPDKKKKSFLSNTGKALQSTPVRQVFTPRALNVGSIIYSDDVGQDNTGCFEQLEFHKPSYKYDNYQRDMFDYLPLPELPKQKAATPPTTPPPSTQQHSMEYDSSYNDEFFTDDFSNESLPGFDDLGLPALY